MNKLSVIRILAIVFEVDSMKNICRGISFCNLELAYVPRYCSPKCDIFFSEK